MSLTRRLQVSPKSIDTPKDTNDSLHSTRVPATSTTSGRWSSASSAGVLTVITSDFAGFGSNPILIYQSCKASTALAAGHVCTNPKAYILPCIKALGKLGPCGYGRQCNWKTSAAYSLLFKCSRCLSADPTVYSYVPCLIVCYFLKIPILLSKCSF